ncbi:retinol dehydrogenase 13 [Plutella xylostella]|uniref:retinol dehydrogenase 13 n=1 Tax=Plutella xylostella TaxID=51655 RepID=UPI002032C60A|nr:retinol dehydrogenase 13 [Plutella xylostella]
MCKSKASLIGKTAVVTGGSSGFGYDTARLLAERGARVIIASRSEAKLANATESIRRSTGNENVDYRQLDMSSLTSVRHFASETLLSEQRLDILINNVGAINLPDKLTEDGLNTMMQVNYFGAFLLTYLLLPFLIASGPSRVINVSAATMYVGTIDFDHLNDVEYWSPLSILANSKLATSLFTVELSEMIKYSGVTANSFDPFVVADTGILDNLGVFKDIGKVIVNSIGRRREDVANEIVFMASDPSLERVTGKHFKFCRSWFNSWLAEDVQLRRRLWTTSKELVKVKPSEEWDESGKRQDCL